MSTAGPPQGAQQRSPKGEGTPVSTARMPVTATAGATVPSLDYTPQDRMFVFWLQNPAVPVLVGTLDLSLRLRGGVFRYADHWLRDDLSLSPDLPWKPGEFQREPDHLPGAIDDARPDRWGELVIRPIDTPPSAVYSGVPVLRWW
jgi:hypothetical protein